ncbi:MAG TPA: HAD family phosphatase [Candidatus Saccharimonadales bacterium]|nr:HAD family phosphatase [Candidatus Saccharimonadales bacterium]
MNKAFIFDMDGVIIDTERTRALYEREFYEKLFGKEIAEKVGPTIGMSLPVIYDVAATYGFSMEREMFYNLSHTEAKRIYEQAAITEGFEELIQKIKAMDFKIGLVSASPALWIDLMFKKTKVRHFFDYILSLHEREDLNHKPHPDGYIAAMSYLQSSPETTIILEDSNRGIQSAKASGAFTIGFRQNLQKEYQQTGADMYADTMDDVLKIVEKRFYEK